MPREARSGPGSARAGTACSERLRGCTFAEHSPRTRRGLAWGVGAGGGGKFCNQGGRAQCGNTHSCCACEGEYM